MTARASLSIRDAADILGIAEQASINEIRSRYHALVKEWHPDVSDYDSEDTHNTMIRLNHAYDILTGTVCRSKFHSVPKTSCRPERPILWIPGWNGMVTIRYGGPIGPLRVAQHSSRNPFSWVRPIIFVSTPSFFSNSALDFSKTQAGKRDTNENKIPRNWHLRAFLQTLP
jgi:hypothetical protein